MDVAYDQQHHPQTKMADFCQSAIVQTILYVSFSLFLL
jgi:hypothetical protein